MRILTTPEQRSEFYRRHMQGQTYQEIAELYGLSRECVRYWCRRQRRGGSTQTKYQRQTGGILSQFSQEVKNKILEMRRAHPRWGPGVIVYKLRQDPQTKYQRIPSRASVGRFLHQWPEFRRKRRPKIKIRERPDQPTRVHQRWQIDFKLDIQLADQCRVNLHTVRDPFAGATLGAMIYPVENTHRQVKHVSVENVRTTLRQCFAQWGTLPDEVQTDGEATLSSPTDEYLPSKFTLWLMGLGCKHRVTRSGKPTDNAEVERCHRTLNGFAIVGNEHLDISHLQFVLDGAVEELNYELPSQANGCDGQPPITAHPDLLRPPRPYRPELELHYFDLERVDRFLASFVWERKVSKQGQFKLGGQHQRYCVGRQYAHQSVNVRFDPADRHFVAFQLNEHGQSTELRRWPARHLDFHDLLGLPSLPSGLGPQQLLLPLPSPKGVYVQ